jgi:MGT family glycosyltransferase
MASFLIAVWPFRSHFFPLVGIASALRRRGHHVAFYSGGEARAVIEGEGFPLFPFERLDERRVMEIMFQREEYASMWRPLRFRRFLREWLLGTVPAQVEDLTAVTRRMNPDVIVSETSMWGPILILRERDSIPVAVFSTVAACMIPGSNVPPFGFGLPRPRTAAARLGVSLANRAVDVFSRGMRQAASASRREHGLPGLPSSVTAHSGAMDLYLVPSTREFDYERNDLPPTVRYVGPCVWNKTGSEEPPRWLETLRRPSVHVTEGTMHTQRPVLLEAAARGLGGLPMSVVMTTGGHRRTEDLGLGPLAPNVRVEPWVAHADLMPRTDVLVSTGGAGTVMTALAAGVPMVVVPTEWDKPENAQRVVEAGAGIRLSPGRLTPRRLRLAVETILGEPRFRESARRMARSFASRDGLAEAAQLLEELAETAKRETGDLLLKQRAM